MGLWKVLPILLVSIHSTLAVWTLQKMATQMVPSDYINNNEQQFTYNGGAANSVAYDPTNSFAYIAGDKFVQVVDFSRMTRPRLIRDRRQRLTAPATDIAQCGFLVAWITRGAKITDPGTVHVWDKYRRVSKRWNNLCTGQVGSNPVSLRFFHNCETLVIANKGTAAEDPQSGAFTDPEGTISIVRIVKSNRQQQQQGGQPNFPRQQGQGRYPSTQGTCAAQFGHQMTITNIDFRRFNNMVGMQFLQGIRTPYDGSLNGQRPTLAQSLEPTYVTGDPTYNDTAYVSLRENNAIVQLILTPGNEGITGFNPMGLKSWFNNNLDASSTPRAKVSFGRHDVYSLRQPNAIEPFEIRSYFGLESYLFTADEGAPTSYTMGNKRFSDAIPASQLQNPPQNVAQGLRDPAKLGNLQVSKVDGLRNPMQPNSGYDYVSFFGGRGISMFKFNETSSNLDLVWDSGDQIARAVAEFYPQVFNSKSYTPDAQSHGPVSQMDQASTKRGAQCKSLAVAKINPTTSLVFVGVDGPSVIGIFSVSSNGSYPNFESVYRKAPQAKRFSILMENKRIGDIDPSKLVFIPKAQTPDNFNYLMVTGKKSGTLTMYRILNQSRANMMNRLRKEARASATAISRSLPVILMSFLVAAIARVL